jgi:hypothetical protein
LEIPVIVATSKSSLLVKPSIFFKVAALILSFSKSVTFLMKLESANSFLAVYQLGSF